MFVSLWSFYNFDQYSNPLSPKTFPFANFFTLQGLHWDYGIIETVKDQCDKLVACSSILSILKIIFVTGAKTKIQFVKCYCCVAQLCRNIFIQIRQGALTWGK